MGKKLIEERSWRNEEESGGWGETSYVHLGLGTCVLSERSEGSAA